MCLFCDDSNYSDVTTMECPKAPNLWPTDFVPYPYSIMDITDMDMTDVEPAAQMTVEDQSSPPQWLVDALWADNSPVDDRSISLPSPPPVESPENDGLYHSFYGNSSHSAIHEFAPSFLDNRFHRRIGDFDQSAAPILAVPPILRVEADSTQPDFDDISSVSSIEFEDNFSSEEFESDYEETEIDGYDVTPQQPFDAPIVEGIDDLEYVGVSDFHQLYLTFGMVNLQLYHSDTNGIFVF